jgi:hypothetical protein
VFCYDLFVETLNVSRCLTRRMQVEGDEDKEGGTNVVETKGVTPHVSKPHDYVNHMFMRP